MVDFEPLGALVGLGAPEAVLIDFVAGRSLKYSLNGSLTKKRWNPLVNWTTIHQTLIIPWFGELWLNLLSNFNVFSSGCRLSYTSGYVPLQNRSKRPPVLRDQKVLPDRGSKSTTFAMGKFQVSNPQKLVANPIGEPSVSPFQCPIYLWLQAAAWDVSWRLVCCELQVDTVSKI